jgi:hypothetical protein
MHPDLSARLLPGALTLELRPDNFYVDFYPDCTGLNPDLGPVSITISNPINGPPSKDAIN